MEKKLPYKIKPENPAGEKVIEISDLRKSFDDHNVLTNVNLHVSKGENLVVLGKSGSGKSVLIKCIVGLIAPDEGKIKVLDKDVTQLSSADLNELRKKIGFLFQSAALYDSMSVKENLLFPLKRHLKETSQKEMDDLVHEVLSNVGLEDSVYKMPSELSGGMKKRIGLARTLIMKPDIVLYDEPTTGLDPITSNEISMLIKEMQNKYKISSIIITHDIPCARHTGNRIIVLRDGEITTEGTYDELEKSEDKWVQSFFL